LIRKKKRRYSDRLHWQAKFKNKLMASIWNKVEKQKKVKTINKIKVYRKIHLLSEKEPKLI
jgi:hypothetical protein